MHSVRRWGGGRVVAVAAATAVMLLGFGMATASAAATFSDNFEDGNSAGWTPSVGTWTVVRDGTQALRGGASTAADAKAFAGSSSWTNYTAQASVKPVSFDGTNRFVGLAARAQDAANYYYLALRSNNTAELKKLVAGAPTVLGSATVTVTAGAWYTLRLELNGSTIRGFVNGNQVASATDTQFSNGRVGVIAYSAVGSYDDVTVEETVTPGPSPSSPPPSSPPPGTGGPCDIYAAGGTPCVAAHSTTRALYAAYNGPLYQVKRSSDNTTRDIGPLSPGGTASAATQDSFCSGTTCLISVIYDQSGRGNHLTQAPPGGFRGPAPGGYDNLANAIAAPTTVNGSKAYGVYVAPGTGYRNNKTNGVATGDQPEGMYAVFDGTHYNGGCCFDYGNAETNSRDNGNGTMEAIYFGSNRIWGYGAGNGPWVMADLENGLFSGVNTRYNAGDPTVNHRYLTAIIKGEPNHWAIRAGNAQSGGLSTFYDGKRPNAPGYNPMKKEGAIILGIGGDNSITARGTFYEGVMTSGYPSQATENAVQANIVAAGYK